MAAPVLIIGSGAQARYVIDIFRAQSQPIAGLVDVLSRKNVGKKINGVSIKCFIKDLPAKFHPQKHRVIIGYGNSKKKKEIAKQLKKHGYAFANAISRQTALSPTATWGQGCIVNPGAYVMPNAQIGSHVIVHSLCVVEHDCVIGDFANLAPGVTLAGRVRIGEGAILYTGCKVIPDISIGKDAVVAAGAVVTKNVPPGTLVGGVPAHALKSRGR